LIWKAAKVCASHPPAPCGWLARNFFPFRSVKRDRRLHKSKKGGNSVKISTQFWRPCF